MLLLPLLFLLPSTFLPALLRTQPSTALFETPHSPSSKKGPDEPAPFAVPGKTSAIRNATNLPLPVVQTESMYQSTLSRTPHEGGKLSESQIYNLLEESSTAFLSLKFPQCVENYDVLTSQSPSMYLPLHGLSLFFTSEYAKALAVLRAQSKIVMKKFSMLPSTEETILHNYILLKEFKGDFEERKLIMEEKDVRPLFQLVYGCLMNYGQQEWYDYLVKLKKIYRLTTTSKSSDDKTLSYFYLSLVTSLSKTHPFETYIQRGHEIESPGINGVLCLALACKLDCFDDFVVRNLDEQESVDEFLRKEVEGFNYEAIKMALKGRGKAYGKKEDIVEALLGMLAKE
ncbi:hypothetical protein TrVE_jg830 [Triparma verrucosa]|uniref:Uncharacterized protein n=1 Tax=Triparma verrucosa TaxID=1606542 RepID=A0A9W7DPK5_9STRA|nr:hypothetical protein TrVE_jg830 [Triparma verrucosa]